MRTKQEYEKALIYIKTEIDWNISYKRQVEMQKNIAIIEELIDNLKEKNEKQT